ncbi:Spy/CpxP family protein refolding chaperone [Shewanella dokdonensis]|uniref:Spy/CpxP family protein refolding chaperone n=1 Tax=Shewanella dokdonensis TaxID=712036 RepID=A0ABX8DB88_9GAMM|nr:Spy/CpxP family protein refolding chaperone [Shewanella dokdonensis]MCL1075712.1 Spy/CpxP family protein refolding chaperone [Shewanella dokdonensis]QVK21868.1 Spy/CpxP family protein refolding chaperone [Shewanella dokdonensis]
MVKHLKTGMVALVAASSLWATGAFAADTDKADKADVTPSAAPTCPCPQYMGQGMMRGQGMGMMGQRMPGAMHRGFQRGMGMGWDHMGFIALHQLDLTDEQKTAIKKLFDAQRDSMKAERSARHQAMQAVMTAAKFDESKAKKLIEQQQQWRTQQQLQRMKLHHQIYQLLTAEQQANLKKQLEKMPMWNTDQDD